MMLVKLTAALGLAALGPADHAVVQAVDRDRVLEQLARLRKPAADEGPLFATLARPDPSILDPRTLHSMQQLDAEAWRLLFHLLQRGAERGDEQAEAV